MNMYMLPPDPESSFPTTAHAGPLNPRSAPDPGAFLTPGHSAHHLHVPLFYPPWHPDPYHHIAPPQSGGILPAQYAPRPSFHPPHSTNHAPPTFYDPFPPPPNRLPFYNYQHPWKHSYEQFFPIQKFEHPYYRPYDASSPHHAMFNDPPPRFPHHGYTRDLPFFHKHQGSLHAIHNHSFSPCSLPLPPPFPQDPNGVNFNAPDFPASKNLLQTAIPTPLPNQSPGSDGNHCVSNNQIKNIHDLASSSRCPHNTPSSFQAAQAPMGTLLSNMVLRSSKTLRRPRRDYFIFTAVTYELMARALRADKGLPEFADATLAESAVSHSIPLSSAHHAARLTRKKWMRLKCRMQWYDNKPSRRCLTWKSCPLIIVPKEDWPAVLYECLVQSGTGSTNGLNSFNLTYLTLRKVYQTRRSRCGIPRDVCDAFISRTATYVSVTQGPHLVSEHASEEDYDSASGDDDKLLRFDNLIHHPPPLCSSSAGHTSRRSGKRSRSIDKPQSVRAPRKRLYPNHKPISIISLLSDPKPDSATELLC